MTLLIIQPDFHSHYVVGLVLGSPIDPIYSRCANNREPKSEETNLSSCVHSLFRSLLWSTSILCPFSILKTKTYSYKALLLNQLHWVFLTELQNLFLPVAFSRQTIECNLRCILVQKTTPHSAVYRQVLYLPLWQMSFKYIVIFLCFPYKITNYTCTVSK